MPPTRSKSADVIMLAGDRRAGAHAVRAVKTNAIIGDAETPAPHSVVAVERTAVHDDHARALCEAAVTLADRARGAGVVAVTAAAPPRARCRRCGRARRSSPRPSAGHRPAAHTLLGVVPLCMPIGDNLDEATCASGRC